MRLRLGFLMGFGAGYYLGAKAGRQRYEQINNALRKLRGSDEFQEMADKASAMVDLGMERAKDMVPSGNGS